MHAHMPIIRDIVYGAVARGASLNDLCADIGIEPSQLNDSGQRLKFEEAYRTWECAFKLTRDPLLGLHIGESANPTILGLVGHLMQSSPDLLQAFQNVCIHAEVATDMFQYHLKQKGEQVFLQFRPAALWVNVSASSARHATEQAMAGTLQVFYLLSGHRVYPQLATFNYKRPSAAHAGEYERVFQSPVKFNAPASELIFSEHQLNIPVLSYDRSLLSVFERLLKEKKTKANPTWVQQLRQLILGEFSGQVPAIEILASRMNLTTRSLQRRLAEEGTTYREFTTAIKSEVASQLLAAQGSKVTQVAQLLGYSEASAFRRAYKQWNNKTPRQR